ncbi:Crp family transcriptional regulator [Oscillochloris trichoides DG-6]|uniref:Crp family transcriptional regulator n=1 Tax=Oscillochloris trichoides DG-6 TaxID=765420 RepID=E1IG06_9CHLR|nr:Crp/Fnr family transcriptional regulator [Oscillochloris trichoides]EFO79895.1 Crp family transcriptional regulator [Oscillochloris trichoides DG-6]
MHIELLRRCQYFADLPDQTLAAAAAAAQLRRVPTGDFIFRQGESASHFYVLAEGHARLSQISPEGRQIIMGLIGPPIEIGIIAAIQGAVYPLDLQATQDCQALAWEHRTLIRLLESHPMLALRALRMVSGRFVELQDRYRELATERVERRLARALLRLVNQSGRPDGDDVTIALPLARQDLAELTGTTLYTVSRTLSAWESSGIIRSGRERVTLCDLPRLSEIAEG